MHFPNEPDMTSHDVIRPRTVPDNIKQDKTKPYRTAEDHQDNTVPDRTRHDPIRP